MDEIAKNEKDSLAQTEGSSIKQRQLAMRMFNCALSGDGGGL